MRVNVQLIDGVTGNHLWADRFDKPLADLFDMQDEIVSHLTNQVRPELIAVEAERAEHEANPDSLDYYFRGAAAFNKGRRDNLSEPVSFSRRPSSSTRPISTRSSVRRGSMSFLAQSMPATTALSGLRRPRRCCSRGSPSSRATTGPISGWDTSRS